jgi:SulP family sulfate permease
VRARVARLADEHRNADASLRAVDGRCADAFLGVVDSNDGCRRHVRGRFQVSFHAANAIIPAVSSSADASGSPQRNARIAKTSGMTFAVARRMFENALAFARAKAQAVRLHAVGALPIAYAIRRAFRKGYTLADLRADVLAGVVVAIVALPLSMALAIAVGAAPEHGLYTAIFAGFATSLLGGCKFQVTGPTAAFVVILAPIVGKYGVSGLLMAGFMAGLMLIAMGAFKLGSLIKFIPYPVTTGFTTGIATVIATIQVKDLLGLHVSSMPDHYVERVVALWHARATMHWQDPIAGVATLTLLVAIPRVTKRIPAPLLALAGVAGAVAATHHFVPSFDVATIGTRFHTVIDGVDVAGIPRAMPTPSLPWRGALTFTMLRELFSSAFAIAMLGAIESLLSAVIADGMTQTKHDPNAELVGLGIGNVIAPIFGGIAATGALARTATNIRAGARSPIAAATHSVVVLLAMLVLAPLVSFIPMASLAALLVLVAWNMSELHTFVGIMKVAPRSDVIVLVTCFLLTVFFDMVVAVSVGFVMAAVLFMRRMSELTQSKMLVDNTEEHRRAALPRGTIFYEVNGPLFFGAASRAMEALHASETDAFDTIIIHLGKVPVIDATGLAALENAVIALVRRKKRVLLAGPLPAPEDIFARAALDKHSGVHVTPDLPSAVDLARSAA